MTIVQGEDGYITFTIPVNPNEPDIYIPSFDEYVNLLNDEDLASSLINRHGLITTPEVHGSFIQTRPNKFGIVLGPEFSPLIYRGQNNDYDFMPSYYRYELADGQERIRHSIDWIKRNEFLQLISNTPYFTRTQNFKVLNNNYFVDLEAVSKLYNCVSGYLDVTRNLMVAYFFAYTYLDKEKNQLLPVEDFEKYSPMLYVGNLKTLNKEVPESVKNMGLQPFLRAKVQQTMSVNVLNDFTKVKSYFKRIELPKNAAVAKNIFNQFEGGKVLFPGDYASRCVTQIRKHNTLQEQHVEEYCLRTETDEAWLKHELKKAGYELINQPWNIPEQARYMINRELDELIIPYYNSNIVFRGMKKI